MTPRFGHVGITISPLELCAVREASSLARAILWRAPLDPFSADASGWPSLTAALRELAKAHALVGGVLSVALMAPLVEVRTLDLPVLREEELRALVSRNAQRYFTAARGPQIVAISVGSRRGGEPVLAAAAPSRTIAAIHAAARDAGWTIDNVVPAESAWAAATRAHWPALARRAGGALVLQQDRADLVLLTEGRLSAVRRFRANATDAHRIADAASTRSGGQRILQLGVAGSSNARQELVTGLSGLGIATTVSPATLSETAAQADRLAATYASVATDLRLRTDDVREAKGNQAKRLAMWIAAAAAALLVLAGALELWGVQRQLDEVQAQRAALKPQLSTTLVGRTSVDMAYRQLAAVNAAERSSPQWTTVVAHIASGLDDDAYLTAFKGHGDSLVVEGVAAHAAKVFEDLETTPGLSQVRAAAPVRREAPNGADGAQRFTIAARVATASPVRAPSRGGGK